jgi:hypothetical protein
MHRPHEAREDAVLFPALHRFMPAKALKCRLFGEERFEKTVEQVAAVVVEVVEHLDPPRLSAFERVLFEFAKPRTIVLTTPNREYNATWETLPAGQFRHPGHRFEWNRKEF